MTQQSTVLKRKMLAWRWISVVLDVIAAWIVFTREYVIIQGGQWVLNTISVFVDLSGHQALANRIQQGSLRVWDVPYAFYLFDSGDAEMYGEVYRFIFWMFVLLFILTIILSMCGKTRCSIIILPAVVYPIFLAALVSGTKLDDVMYLSRVSFWAIFCSVLGLIFGCISRHNKKKLKAMGPADPKDPSKQQESAAGWGAAAGGVWTAAQTNREEKKTSGTYRVWNSAEEENRETEEPSSKPTWPEIHVSGQEIGQKVNQAVQSAGSFLKNSAANLSGKKTEEATQLRCPRCGELQPEGAKFCRDCGASLKEAAGGGSQQTKATDLTHCKSCGAVLTKGAKFCPVCGQKVS